MLHLIDEKAKKISEEAWKRQEIIFSMSSICTIPIGVEAGGDIGNSESASLSTWAFILEVSMFIEIIAL